MRKKILFVYKTKLSFVHYLFIVIAGIVLGALASYVWGYVDPDRYAAFRSERHLRTFLGVLSTEERGEIIRFDDRSLAYGMCYDGVYQDRGKRAGPNRYVCKGP